MKAFIISLVTLIILTSAAAVNCTVIGGICDRLLELADELPALPSEDRAAADRLREVFSEKEKYLTLSVNHTEIDALESLITEIKSKQETSDYIFAMEMFRIKVSELKESESFSFERIF